MITLNLKISALYVGVYFIIPHHDVTNKTSSNVQLINTMEFN